MKLGDIQLSSNLLTSPMCGISNRPFRLLAKRFGSALTYVEMLKARSVIERTPRTMELLRYYADEKPLGAQLAGSEPQELAEAAKIVEDLGFDTIDFNCGCPAGRVGHGLCGARIMSKPNIARECMRALRAAVKVPVTVKFRAGMDDTALNYLEFGRIAQEEGMAWVTMHPRTRAQGYKGGADHRRTAELKASIRIPVNASGDVTEPEHALAIARDHGIDGVMIGRGIYGRPWLYRRILAAQAGESESDPTPREVLAVLRWHFERLLEVFRPRLACIMQRRYSGWYIKAVPGAASWRAAFVTVETPEEFFTRWKAVDDHYAGLEAAGKIAAASPGRLASYAE
ncbi:MAG: tRNA dihydrouridine synthase DusB, partial [Planctomycetes bacterium]|nr:tRNA dihydrouridine synthase DusB [Planctomycetota bacterium]